METSSPNFDPILDQLEPTDFEGMRTGSDLEQYVLDIKRNVQSEFDQNVTKLAPWFFSVMPPIYYQATPRAEKQQHFSAMLSLGGLFDSKQTLELWNHDKSKVTYMGSGGCSSMAHQVAHKIKTMNLKMGSFYFSKDRKLFLATFNTKSFKNLDIKNDHLKQKLERVSNLLEKQPQENKGNEPSYDHYLKNLDQDFVIESTAERIAHTCRMVQKLQNQEGAYTFFEPIPQTSGAKVTLGLKGVSMTLVMEDIFRLIERYGFILGRSFFVELDQGYEEPVCVMNFMISLKEQQAILKEDNPNVLRLIKAIRTLAWVDTDDYAKLAYNTFDLSLNGVNLLRSMGSFAHILLSKENPYYYNEDKILKTFVEHESISTSLVELFRLKFDPVQIKNKEELYHQGIQKIEKLLGLINQDIVAAKILKTALDFVQKTIKTNYFIRTKTGLAFRLTADILDPKFYSEKPYGIFFIVGRDYRFFHVRWKDIARGGLRVVMPKTSVDHGVALGGMFDEVYGLSRAQQLKNKDIPEGGSKAVLVLKPQGHKNRAVKGAINALLDLLVTEDESHEIKHSSVPGGEEIIYLGPDENITNDLIQWIPIQAKKRNYPYALAFMSSKPASGINHKEYGVTSEGLQVFVDHMLKHLKLENFRVKMTGGPDGDVAGNGLKIIHREYGERAKIVAISDGYGAAYDPQGLSWKELLRLVTEGLPISHFPKTALSSDKKSFVVLADSPENMKIRNELHFKAEAEIFIPAGGRPYTVTEENYKMFVNPETQKLTSLAVVEGANIFFTDQARSRLQELGLLMIKDSSANKTGVICSSFEIIASLLLTEDEFIQMKPQYVSQVIKKLRSKADAEARLLFDEYQTSKKSLVALSMEISREINQLTDLLLEELTKSKDKILSHPVLQKIVIQHCPDILIEKYSDRWKKLPIPHIIAICASSIASYIVYQEGLGFMESFPLESRYHIAMNYMNQTQKVHELLKSVETSQIKNKEDIVNILKRNAARDLTIYSS